MRRRSCDQRSFTAAQRQGIFSQPSFTEPTWSSNAAVCSTAWPVEIQDSTELSMFEPLAWEAFLCLWKNPNSWPRVWVLVLLSLTFMSLAYLRCCSLRPVSFVQSLLVQRMLFGYMNIKSAKLVSLLEVQYATFCRKLDWISINNYDITVSWQSCFGFGFWISQALNSSRDSTIIIALTQTPPYHTKNTAHQPQTGGSLQLYGQ